MVPYCIKALSLGNKDALGSILSSDVDSGASARGPPSRRRQSTSVQNSPHPGEVYHNNIDLLQKRSSSHSVGAIFIRLPAATGALQVHDARTLSYRAFRRVAQALRCQATHLLQIAI